MVIAGDDKGKTGRVLAVDPEKQRVVVEKVNFVKRHTQGARGRACRAASSRRRRRSTSRTCCCTTPKAEPRRRASACGVLPDGTARAHLARERRDAGEGGVDGTTAERRHGRTRVERAGEGPGRPRWRREEAAKAPKGGEAAKAAKAAKAGKRRRGGGARRGPVEAAAERPGRRRGCAKHYEEKVRPGADEEVRLHATSCRRRAWRRSCVNMGVGDALPNAKLLDAAAERAGADHGPEARRCGARRSRSRTSSCARASADRLRGDAARRAHVRVLRPAGQRGDARASATSAALPPRSFDGRGNYTLGLHGADHLPGDQLRQGREDPRHGHDHRDDGADRRGRARAAAAHEHALPRQR